MPRCVVVLLAGGESSATVLALFSAQLLLRVCSGRQRKGRMVRGFATLTANTAGSGTTKT